MKLSFGCLVIACLVGYGQARNALLLGLELPTHGEVIASHAQLSSIVGQVSLLQTEDACLDAVTDLNDTLADLEAVELAETCATIAETLSTALSGEVATDETAFNAACDDYVADCTAVALPFIEAGLRLLQDCKSVNISDPDEALTVSLIQLGATVVLLSNLFAETLCLEIDGEYCVATIADALDDVSEDCSNEFQTTSCSSTCNDEAADFIDASGCCMAAWYGSITAVANLLDDTIDATGDELTIDASLCEQSFESCPEADALLQDFGIEFTGSATFGAAHQIPMYLAPWIAAGVLLFA